MAEPKSDMESRVRVLSAIIGGAPCLVSWFVEPGRVILAGKDERVYFHSEAERDALLRKLEIANA